MMHSEFSFLIHFLSILTITIRRCVTPYFCITCRIYYDECAIFCCSCIEKLVPIVSQKLLVTKNKFTVVHAVSSYSRQMKSLILAKRWGDMRLLYYLGDMMAQKIISVAVPFDYIVPIPLHWTRFAYRGFNQAEILAQVIAVTTQKPMLKALTRIKKTPFQSAIQATLREKNVQGAFKVRKKYLSLIQGKHILLVDDLLTTGATIRCASKALYAEKPSAIITIVGARCI